MKPAPTPEIRTASILKRMGKKYWIDKVTGCWNWVGCVEKSGYGRIWVTIQGHPRKGKMMLAHRLMYELHNNVLLGDRILLHDCDNRSCVNPDHLTPGNQSENMKDMWGKGRR